jgi:beta-glucosidase/6-phospho-beta-glucosidase/beta-galactosidase
VAGLGCVTQPSAPFASTFIGGFECSAQQLLDGRRLDLLAGTRHDDLAEADYRALAEHGVSCARDGFRWHLIEQAPGRYDWSSALPMLRAARRAGTQVIWDLCHYGWPDHIDIWSDDFVERFAAFAAAAARLVGSESDFPPFFCPVNEISFWSWAGGETGGFAPFVCGMGSDLKRQLVRAAMAAVAAIRSVSPRARFIHAEPGIHVAPSGSEADDTEAAEAYRQSQFEALDLMSGRQEPELGGRPDYVDIVGINYYPHNQWYHNGNTIPLGHHAYRPLRALLAEAWRRYRKPLIISETGAEGTCKGSWLHYVCGEVRAARAQGVPVLAICLYPILDYPGWTNDRHCSTGLLSMADGTGRRSTDVEFLAEFLAQQARFASP